MSVANFGPAPRSATSAAANFAQGDPGRYLDIDAVEVEAVYVLGAEVYHAPDGWRWQHLGPP